jgi:hypothetical protein
MYVPLVTKGLNSDEETLLSVEYEVGRASESLWALLRREIFLAHAGNRSAFFLSVKPVVA